MNCKRVSSYYKTIENFIITERHKVKPNKDNDTEVHTSRKEEVVD